MNSAEPLEQRLVKLARMARQVAAVRKDDAPRQVGHPAVELAIDEVGEAPEEQAEGHRRRDHVDQRPDRNLPRSGEEDHGEDRAEEAAVERHAAVPERDDLRRVLGEARQVVDEHVADAAADDDAERAPDDEVVDVRRLHRSPGRSPEPRIGDQALGVPPAEEDADDIGERVPADGKRADLDQHRIDCRKG